MYAHYFIVLVQVYATRHVMQITRVMQCGRRTWTQGHQSYSPRSRCGANQWFPTRSLRVNGGLEGHRKVAPRNCRGYILRTFRLFHKTPYCSWSMAQLFRMVNKMLTNCDGFLSNILQHLSKSF